VWWADLKTKGWFYFYVYTTPRSNAELHLRGLALFLPQDIFAPLGVACLVILAGLLMIPPDWRSPVTRFYLLTLAIFPLCAFIRMHGGSTGNSVMPAYAILAVLFGVSVARLDGWIHAAPGADSSATLILSGDSAQRSASCVLYTAVLIQLLAGFYNPGRVIPGPTARGPFDNLLLQLRRQPGDALLSEHAFYGLLAGKGEYADAVSLHDTLGALSPDDAERLRRQMAELIASHQLSTVVFDRPSSVTRFNELLHLDPRWMDWYTVRQEVPGNDPGTRPSWLMLHCPLVASQDGPAGVRSPTIPGCSQPGFMPSQP
jgi:hypothetical protein